MAMFKVGSTYTITMWEGGENGGEGTFGGCKVIEVDGTCIKYVNPYDNKGREIIPQYGVARVRPCRIAGLSVP
jgi:hypothetical protein